MNHIQPFNVAELPNSSFNIYVGKRRTGKSTLVEHQIRQMMAAKMLDIAFLFSPTDAGFPMIPKEYRYDTVDELPTIVQNMKLINEYNKVAPKRDKIKARVLIVLDDNAIHLKSKGLNILEELSTCGRHHAYEPCSLHFCILSQSLTKIPRVCRLNCDCIFMAQQSSRVELDQILNENFFVLDGSREGMREGRALFNELIISEPFLFVVVENFRQNVKAYGDYIKKYIAEI